MPGATDVHRMTDFHTWQAHEDTPGGGGGGGGGGDRRPACALDGASFRRELTMLVGSVGWAASVVLWVVFNEVRPPSGLWPAALC